MARHKATARLSSSGPSTTWFAICLFYVNNGSRTLAFRLFVIHLQTFIFSSSRLQTKLEAIKLEPLYASVIQAKDMLLQTQHLQHEALKVQVIELAQEDSIRAKEIAVIHAEHDVLRQMLVDKHKQTNEMWTHNVSIVTNACEEAEMRLRTELDRISACKLKGCGVEDLILVVVSTGAQPEIETMLEKGTDYRDAICFVDELDVQEATGIMECGDLYRVLHAVRSVLEGNGVPVMFDIDGREDSVSKWGMDQTCEWFEFKIFVDNR